MSQNFVKAKQDELQGLTGKANKGQPGGNSGTRQDVNNKNMNPNNQGIKGQDGLATSHVHSATRQSNNDPVTNQPGPQQTLSGQTPPQYQNQGNSRNTSHGRPLANQPGPLQAQGEQTPLQFKNQCYTQNPNQQRNHPPDSQVEADQTGSLHKNSTTGHGNQDLGHGNLTRLQQEAHTGQVHNIPSSPEQNGGQQLQEYQPESGQGPGEGQKSGQHDPYGQGQGNNLAPDKTVEHAWEKLIFQVIFRDDRSSKVKPVVFDASKYLDKFKVQFALTYSLELVRDSFRARKKKMTLEKDAIVFEVKSSVYGNKQEMMIKDNIVNDFKEIMIDQLHVIEIPFKNEIAQSVLDRLKQGVPVLIEHKKVAVYRNRERSGEVSIEIVGERIDCEKLLKELQVDLDEVKKLCHFHLTFIDDECDVLEALKFEERIKNKYQGVINMDVRPITMDFSTYRDKRKVQDDGRQFLQEVSHEKVNFEQSEYSDCIRSLLFGDDGRLNQVFSKFLNKKMEKEIKQLCPYYVHLGKDNNDIIVICSDKSFSKKVCHLVEKTVHIHRGNLESDEAKKFITREERAGKIKVIHNGNHVTAVVCTDDLSETVLGLLSKPQEVFEIPSLVCQFLTDHDHDVFSRCKEGLGIELSVENKKVKIEGQEIKDVKEGKRRFRNEINSLRRSLLDVPKQFEEKEKMKMDELMTSLYCSWQYQASNRDVHEQLKNCEYLLTWYNPNTSFKVTAVRGDPKDLAVDNYVMFVSQSLHPVDDQGIDKVSVIALAAILEEKFRVRDKTWKVGDVEKIGHLQGLACKDVTGLVVMDGMNYISVEELKCALAEHFQGSHTYRNILVQAVTSHSFLKMANIIKVIVNTAISYFSPTNRTTIKEVFICCTKEAEYPVIESINSSFQQCKGYGKKLHNDVYAAEFKKEEEEDLKVLVCKGSLPEFRVDILVNTTSPSLDLSKGMVSAKILEIAGPQIQTDCKNHYKNGIQFGEIAVTKSYNMKPVKLIFHGALPEFNSSVFEFFLNQFVKRCLHEAEEQSCETIAFPALGVGNLAYPKRDAARIMFDAVEEFRRERINGKLREIKFVVYKGDKDTCKVFKSEDWRRSKQCQRDLGKKVSPICSADKFQKICLAGESSQHIEVLLGRQDEIGNLPSHVVEGVFTRGTSTRVKTDLKLARENPKTWNDRVIVTLPRLDDKKLKEATKKIADYCETTRVSEISLTTTSASGFSVGEQVCIFATVLCELTKKDDRYLRRAYIMVPDSSGMKSVESHTLIGKKFILKTPEKTEELGSIEMIGKTEELVDQAKLEVQKLVYQFKEEMVNSSRMDREVSGSEKQDPPQQHTDEHNTETGSDLNDGKHASGHIQKPGDIHHSGNPAVSGTEFGGARPKTQYFSKTNTHEKSQKPESHEKPKESQKQHEASGPPGAENKKTNPKTSVKNNSNKIGNNYETPTAKASGENTEKKKVDKSGATIAIKDGHGNERFTETFTPASGGNDEKKKASISRDTITNKDSDKRLPDVSTQDPGKNTKRKSSDECEERKGISDAEEDESEEEIHLEIGEISAELDQDAIDIIKRNSKWNECLRNWERKFNVRVVEVGRKTFAITSFEEMVQFENLIEELLHELTIATVFEVRGLKVKVYKADITMLDDVDCFGVVAQPRLRNADGIAKEIAKKLGEGYQQKCKESVDKHGEIKKGECRIIVCEKTGISVANMHIPPFQETKKEQIGLLRSIEEALLSCFIEANKLKKKVLALPFIGFGKQKYKLVHCSQEYVRAIQKFSKNHSEKTVLREVHFVGLKEEDISTVVENFKNNLETEEPVKKPKITEGDAVVSKFVIWSNDDGTLV